MTFEFWKKKINHTRNKILREIDQMVCIFEISLISKKLFKNVPTLACHNQNLKFCLGERLVCHTAKHQRYGILQVPAFLFFKNRQDEKWRLKFDWNCLGQNWFSLVSCLAQNLNSCLCRAIPSSQRTLPVQTAPSRHPKNRLQTRFLIFYL